MNEFKKLGRPRKYKNDRDLTKAIGKYFDSISFREKVVDKKSGEAVRNDNGEEVYRRIYSTPPTITGLCLFLVIDRSTWQNYCNAELHPELKDVTERVKCIIEAYLEEQLLTRDKPQGIIFNLENNFGWSEKKKLNVEGDGVNITVKRVSE